MKDKVKTYRKESLSMAPVRRNESLKRMAKAIAKAMLKEVKKPSQGRVTVKW